MASEKLLIVLINSSAFFLTVSIAKLTFYEIVFPNSSDFLFMSSIVLVEKVCTSFLTLSVRVWRLLTWLLTSLIVEFFRLLRLVVVESMTALALFVSYWVVSVINFFAESAKLVVVLPTSLATSLIPEVAESINPPKSKAEATTNKHHTKAYLLIIMF